MAGRKQHFIPQSFLKGFVIPDGNDKLWLYKKDSDKPIRVPRKTTARKKHFDSLSLIRLCTELLGKIRQIRTLE